MKLISLTQGQFAKVDDEDYDKLVKRKWWAKESNGSFYAISEVKRNEDGKYRARIWMHRVILNCPEDVLVDHIDGDSLNNCKSNLRKCCHKDNIRNSKVRTEESKTSTYKGVIWNKRTNRWQGTIVFNGKQTAKQFLTELEAAYWYDTMALKLFGEFACINGVDKSTISFNEKKKSSKYSGVWWHKQNKKWIAEIRIKGKKKHIGSFLKEEDAYNATVNFKG